MAAKLFDVIRGLIKAYLKDNMKIGIEQRVICDKDAIAVTLYLDGEVIDYDYIYTEYLRA